jgi:hypothetical protein
MPSGLFDLPDSVGEEFGNIPLSEHDASRNSMFLHENGPGF